MKKNEFPNRKISETFLEFSSPLMDTIGEDVTKYISMVRKAIMKDPITSALIEQMISRKNDIFSDDQRMIGEYSITQKNGEWRLLAEARDPSTI
jgi:hypothetical protein